MYAYLVRRVLIGTVTLLLVTMLVYALIRAMPGSPALTVIAQMDPSKEIDPALLARMEKNMGLDRPVIEAYFVWLGNVFRLDLGESFFHREPVTWLIGRRLGPTLYLSVTSLVLSYLLAIPLGLFAAVRSGTVGERGLSTVLYMLYSFPAFVAALYLQMIFYSKLGWLPLQGMTGADYDTLSVGGKAWQLFTHAIMPVTCYTYVGLAYYSRFIRSNMLDVIRQDYIRTAQAKGVPPLRIIWHHAFRNTLIPLVTLLGITLPALLSGSIILEQIFNWPGMGRLFFESILSQDYPVIMGLVLMFSTLTLLGQLLADVMYSIVDPRVGLS